jgi:putative ABC transport system ATP-binding protein
MSLVRAKEVSKTYRVGEIEVKAIKELSFEIKAASFVSFVGPSGSGKTTLLNLIGCLDSPTSGHLSVAGTDVASLGRADAATFRGNNIGFVFQDFNLIPVLTVFENVEYPLLTTSSVRARERRERVETLLEAVGMSDQAKKFPQQISGGQKQRVAVARALVGNPRVVLADEPTANLDHDTAFRVINLMKSMKTERKTAFIFSTHDPKIVGEAEIIYTLEDGLLVGRETRETGHA